MRGVSLEEVSAATRIAPKYLEALENDQWDQLPGGVFNRGFIRSIARFLGLDVDNLVAEYDLVTQGQKPASAPATLPPQFHRNWTPFVIACAILLVVLAAGAFVVVRFGPRILFHLRRSHGAVSTPAYTPPASPSSAMDASPAVSTSSASAVVPNTGPLELKMDAGKPTEVTIFADGERVFDGHVEPGDSHQFEAKDNFRITSSEASALLLELDGQTLPPIGTPGEPGSITLTRKDLTNDPGGNH